MLPRRAILAALVAIVGTAATPGYAQEAKGTGEALRCLPQTKVEGRESPYDSVRIAAADLEAKICYGRPSMKGRVIFGAEETALVPYGKLWRTGANEPTIIHLATTAEIAGIPVGPGSYSIYTIPGQGEWTIIINRSTSQWGHESRYTAEIQGAEVGRAKVSTETLPQPVETFTIRSAPTSESTGGEIILEWERTRVKIPIEPRGA